MGLVKMGLPLTPTTTPAPSTTSDRHLAVMAAGRIDSAPAALPIRVTTNRSGCPFCYRDISDLVNRDCGVNGSGLPAWDSKCGASSMKDTELYPCGRLLFGCSHFSLLGHRNMAGKKSAPHFQPLGSAPLGRRSVLRAYARGSCSWYQG